MDVEEIVGELDVASRRRDKIKRALSDQPEVPMLPPRTRATPAMRKLQAAASVSWLPMVLQTYSGMLSVEGVTSSSGADVWQVWRQARMDAMQHEVHRVALALGEAHVWLNAWGGATVMGPGESMVRTNQVTGLVDLAVRRSGKSLSVWSQGKLEDFTEREGEWVRDASVASPQPPVAVLQVERDAFGRSLGIIEPLIPAQDAIAAIQLAHLTALHFAAFRQRWVSGLLVPEDADMQSSVTALWATPNPDAKFGDFAQTDTTGHRSAYTQAVRSLAAQAQVAPGLLSGDLTNLSAEALSTMEAPTRRRARTIEAQLAEGWEDVVRLLARASGVAQELGDVTIRWRDSTSRAFASTVDGLAKLGQSLGVPARALWARVPGVSEAEVAEWVRWSEEDAQAGWGLAAAPGEVAADGGA